MKRKYIRVHIVEDMDNPFPAYGCGKEGMSIKIDDNKKLPSGISIGQKMVDDFIKEIHISTLGTKTTMVRAVLLNGFEIIETSACVDEANYSEEQGAKVCLKKIKDKVWYLLGFLLQTATCDLTDYYKKELEKEGKMEEVLKHLIEELKNS